MGADLFGFQQVESIEAWLPIFLFAILFGLSMDYHVFLLSRIRERYDQNHDNTESVAFGVRSTGRLITGAALIMVAVFAGFAAGDLVMFQEMGFGAGIAVSVRRDDRALDPGARDHETARRLELVSAGLAQWLPDVRVEAGTRERVAATAASRSSAPRRSNRTALAHSNEKIRAIRR